MVTWRVIVVALVVMVGSGPGLALKGSDDICPCLPVDKCPRIYGQSAVDVRELGFLEPCRQFGTVRCCGVTVRSLSIL
jgi:hypothetical protein